MKRNSRELEQRAVAAELSILHKQLEVGIVRAFQAARCNLSGELQTALNTYIKDIVTRIYHHDTTNETPENTALVCDFFCVVMRHSFAQAQATITEVFPATFSPEQVLEHTTQIMVQYAQVFALNPEPNSKGISIFAQAYGQAELSAATTEYIAKLTRLYTAQQLKKQHPDFKPPQLAEVEAAQSTTLAGNDIKLEQLPETYQLQILSAQEVDGIGYVATFYGQIFQSIAQRYRLPLQDMQVKKIIADAAYDMCHKTFEQLLGISSAESTETVLEVETGILVEKFLQLCFYSIFTHHESYYKSIFYKSIEHYASSLEYIAMVDEVIMKLTRLSLTPPEESGSAASTQTVLLPHLHTFFEFTPNKKAQKYLNLTFSNLIKDYKKRVAVRHRHTVELDDSEHDQTAATSLNGVDVNHHAVASILEKVAPTLSEREVIILGYMLEGFDNKDILEKMNSTQVLMQLGIASFSDNALRKVQYRMRNKFSAIIKVVRPDLLKILEDSTKVGKRRVTTHQNAAAS